MDAEAIRRANDRLAQAAAGRVTPAELEAALERARAQVEALAVTADELHSTLPDAIRESFRTEALPVARQLAEVRGLQNQLIRRLERIDGDLLAERHARVDDLALLVDLIASSWRAADERLERIEDTLALARLRAA